jgi:transcriptional regulator NrdR family protein
MSSKIHIVKRRGHREAFDERKLYGSVYGACMTTGMREKECEKAAKKVCVEVTKKLKAKKGVVDSTDIFHAAAAALRRISDDAAFMYATHRDVS